MSVMLDSLTETDDLYNPLFLGAVNDVEYLAAKLMKFDPGV